MITELYVVVNKENQLEYISISLYDALTYRNNNEIKEDGNFDSDWNIIKLNKDELNKIEECFKDALKVIQSVIKSKYDI